MATKNITLAVDDDVLDRYRVIAAEQRTSVNALIRKHMEDVTIGAERRRQARARVLELIDRNIARDAERVAARGRGEPTVEETWKWNREDCYSGARFDRMRGT